MNADKRDFGAWLESHNQLPLDFIEGTARSKNRLRRS